MKKIDWDKVVAMFLTALACGFFFGECAYFAWTQMGIGQGFVMTGIAIASAAMWIIKGVIEITSSKTEA